MVDDVDAFGVVVVGVSELATRDSRGGLTGGSG